MIPVDYVGTNGDWGGDDGVFTIHPGASSGSTETVIIIDGSEYFCGVDFGNEPDPEPEPCQPDDGDERYCDMTLTERWWLNKWAFPAPSGSIEHPPLARPPVRAMRRPTRRRTATAVHNFRRQA